MHSQIHQLITAVAERRPSAPAVSDDGGTINYQQLAGLIRGFAAALSGLGARRGDRVAIYLDKRIETVAALFGSSAADCVFVPVNPLLRARQVGHIVRDCGAKVLVTTPGRLRFLRAELAGSPSVEHVMLVGSGCDSALPGGSFQLRSWVADRAAADAGCERARSRAIDVDIAAILYTSGSTGAPKGVVLSHRNLMAGAMSVNSYLGNTADDVILCALPLSFDAGLSQLTTAFEVGAHAVLHNYLLPRELVRHCTQHRVTGLTGVPPLWIQVADQHWPSETAGHLRYFASTGGQLPKTTIDRLRALFPGAQPFVMYGLTEAFRSTYLDPAEIDRRPGSIGKAIPNAEILVVRGDGSLCDPGEEGELVHRGALVSMGYWNDAASTAERFRPAPMANPSGYLPDIAVWSGDRVIRDEEGFLYFVGRADEMIKTSGYRVSPTEIEEAAYQTGLIREAVALGLPDPALGQRIALVVSPKGTGDIDREALLAAIRLALPAYMVPKLIEVRDEIRRSPNGKLDRAGLRAELTA